MKILSRLVLVVAAMACSTQLFSQSTQAQAWFDSKEWLQGADMTAAASLDIDKFAEHYKANPERWQKVFEILSTSDLMALPLGLVEIDENLKMNVQEYTTRPTAGRTLQYEKHTDYIDAQFVITGAELHGKNDVNNATLVREYNPEKDAAMYSCGDVPFYIIEANMFTIFFPDEVHTTNYGFGEQSEVRKIVFKVRY